MKSLLTIAIASVLSASSLAGFTHLTKETDFLNDDVIFWRTSSADNEITTMHGTTYNGIGFTVFSADSTGANDGGKSMNLVQGHSWWGNLPDLETVLWHENESNNGLNSMMAIVFDRPVQGVGVWLDSNNYGAFNGQMRVMNAPLGFQTVSDLDTTTGTVGFRDRTVAPYMATISNSVNIRAVYLSVGMVDGSPDGGLGTPFVDVLDGVVPEPASITAMGVGLVALLRRKGKKIEKDRG